MKTKMYKCSLQPTVSCSNVNQCRSPSTFFIFLSPSSRLVPSPILIVFPFILGTLFHLRFLSSQCLFSKRAITQRRNKWNNTGKSFAGEKHCMSKPKEILFLRPLWAFVRKSLSHIQFPSLPLSKENRGEPEVQRKGRFVSRIQRLGFCSLLTFVLAVLVRQKSLGFCKRL